MKSIGSQAAIILILVLTTNTVAFNSISFTSRVIAAKTTTNPSISTSWHQPTFTSKRSACLFESSSGGDESKIEESFDPQEEERTSPISRLRKRLFPPKEDDGLTFKQKLAKAGLSVVLSYGWVSNVSYSISVSLAWFIFSKQTGLSPLAPQQWKKFLAVYAGFYVFNNIVRPIRLGISVGVSLYFERLVNAIQERLRVKKGVAIFITVFLANVVGTIALMCSGIWLASLAAGVPVFAK